MIKSLLVSISTTLLLVAAAFPTRAQISFGPQLSILDTWARQKIANPYKATASGHGVGFQAGVLLHIPCSPKVSIQPSLLYARRLFEIEKYTGTERTNTTLGTTARVNYLELPVNFLYTIGGNRGLQLFVGPYAALGLSGEATRSELVIFPLEGLGNSQTADVVFARQEGSDARTTTYLRRLDAGLNGGIGYRLGMVQAQLSYSHGLLNRLPRTQTNDSPPDKLYHQALHLSLSYLFSGKSS